MCVCVCVFVCVYVCVCVFHFQDEVASVKKVTYREARFKQFASVEYEGTMYMTPQDFLESITEETPRRKFFTFASTVYAKWD